MSGVRFPDGSPKKGYGIRRILFLTTLQCEHNQSALHYDCAHPPPGVYDRRAGDALEGNAVTRKQYCASPYEARLRRTEGKRGALRFMFALSVNFAFGLNGVRPCLGH